MQDYTVATLTNWGMAEVKQDYKTYVPKNDPPSKTPLSIVKDSEDQCCISSFSEEFPDGFRSILST